MHRWLWLSVCALALTGCSSDEPAADTLPSAPATEQIVDEFHQVRYGNDGCWVDLRDGTSLQLYRVREAESPDVQVTLLVKHSIVLAKPSLEPAVAGQEPIRELSIAVASTAGGEPKWQRFPKPHERGELTLLVYHYRTTVTPHAADAPLHFRIVAAAETYETPGPPINTIPEVRIDAASRRMIPVPADAQGDDGRQHLSAVEAWLLSAGW